MSLERPQRVAFAQASAFFGQGTHPSGQRVVRGLGEEWWSRFDAEPFLLPLDSNAPPAIPRLVARSSQSHEILQVSPVRVDYQRESIEPAEPIDLEEFTRVSGELLAAVRGVAASRVGRIALVVRRIVEDTDATMDLVRHFCQERFWRERGALYRTDTFELHAHKVFETAQKLSVNSWVRNKSMVIGGKKVVLVEQDINTLAEQLEARDYADEELTGFLLSAPAELQQVMDLYYEVDGRE